MTIYEPENWLSPSERELIALLSKLLVQPVLDGSNIQIDVVPLSPVEGCKLLELLEKLVNSRRFRETAYFVEGLSKYDDSDHFDLREIFLSWRKKRGRSRAMSSTHWRAFLNRIGITEFRYSSAARSDIPSPQMTYAYFKEMEYRLLARENINPRVGQLIMSVIDKYEDEVEQSRSGQLAIPQGAILRLVEKVMGRVEQRSNLAVEPLKSGQVAGLCTIIADSAAIFTTRDWSVAGTMSTMAGAFSASMYK